MIFCTGLCSNGSIFLTSQTIRYPILNEFIFSATIVEGHLFRVICEGISLHSESSTFTVVSDVLCISVALSLRLLMNIEGGAGSGVAVVAVFAGAAPHLYNKILSQRIHN